MSIAKILAIFLLVATVSCEREPLAEYKAVVKKELNSGRKVNEIFLGISLGMTSKDFYKHCWDMNQKGLFTEGAGSSSVTYKLVKNELRHPAQINFFPEFQQEKISSLWVRFQYAGWAPWNKELDSDNLLTDVLALYKKWYPNGNSFIKISDKTKGDIYVKVDGNRRIIIGRFDDIQVKVDYADLSALVDKENIR